MYFVMIALLEPGDEVMYPDTGFPIYESMIRFLNAKPVPIPLLESRKFSVDLNLFRERLSPRRRPSCRLSPSGWRRSTCAPTGAAA